MTNNWNVAEWSTGNKLMFIGFIAVLTLIKWEYLLLYILLAYILGANIHRRHKKKESSGKSKHNNPYQVTKGQKHITYALMAISLPFTFFLGGIQSAVAGFFGIMLVLGSVFRMRNGDSYQNNKNKIWWGSILLVLAVIFIALNIYILSIISTA